MHSQAVQTTQHSMLTKKNFSYLWGLSLFAAISLLLATPSFALDHSHEAFTTILKNQVKDGRVNYDALKANPAPLKSYLDTLAAVQKAEFSGWNDQQQMVFLSNLYNAATLQLIVDNYPVKSIKKIGGFFKGPWKQEVVRFFGDKTTLDNVEHGILRKDYDEPRLHFALVCAAASCPPLRSEAYDAARFNEQLDDQGNTFLSNSVKNRVADGGKTLYLSKIFDWYGADFEKGSNTLVGSLKPYLPNGDTLVAKPKIRFTNYDWSLNKQ